MKATEHPLSAEYWFGTADPRPQALFRWLFGLTVCHDLINYARDLPAFLTDNGMLPRGVQADPHTWSVFELVGSTAGAAALFAVGLAAAVCFTIGFRARVAAAVAWFFLTALDTRNLYVTDGGDDLMRCLMFLSIFADLGRCWSLDSWLGRVTTRPARVLALRFLQLHIILLYFCAARLKFRAGWLHINVVWQILQLTGFVRPPGLILAQSPAMCRGSTLLTLVLEFSFAFFALSPWKVGWSRALAVAAGFAVQFGILVSMRVGAFTETMLAAMALFTRPEWFDWLGARLGSKARITPQAEAAPAPASAWRAFPDAFRSSPARALGFALLCFQFILLAWGPFVARRIPPPRALMNARQYLWLDQPFGLFDVVYDIPRWSAEGSTVTGRHVEVLSRAVPDLVPVVRWRFSRWYKFTFKERERPFRFEQLGAFMCREYLAHTGQKLREFSLSETLTPPSVQGQPERPAHTRERWHQVCE
jgi:Vitamin K-dependent gamma-carboxylase